MKGGIVLNLSLTSHSINWLSIPGISILLIFLNSLVPTEIILAIQICLLIVMIKKIDIEIPFLIAFILIFIQSYICILLGNDTFPNFFKQYISIIISALYWLTCINKNNIFDYIILYKKAAIFTSIIAIFQLIARILRLQALSNMAWLIKTQQSTTGERSAAFFSEPSVCALILFPIFFIGLYRLIGKYKDSIKNLIRTREIIIIFFGYFSTFSSAGFIGAGIAIFIIVLEYGLKIKQIFLLLISVLFLGFIYTHNDFISQRVNDTLATINESKSLDQVNVSTQTLILNKDIAFSSFENTNGLGSGLGSHPISYNKYINNFNAVYLIQLNKDDANSMFLRIISELGILGILIYVIFLYLWRYKTKNPQSNKIYRILSLMCFCYILMRFVRYGHYFDYGYFMFITIYYRCGEIYKDSITRLKKIGKV